MWPWRSPKKSQIEDLTEVDGKLREFAEVIDQHSADISTINTAINRLERKQNRWLEILNAKDGGGEVENAIEKLAEKNTEHQENLEDVPGVELGASFQL